MSNQAKTEKKSSSTHILGFELIPGNMDENFKGIMHACHMQHESEVGNLISSFSINSESGIEKTTVDNSKWKSAILLHSFAIRHKKNTFRLSENDIMLIKKYFPKDLIKDAIENPNTKHSTIRKLLTGNIVTVTIIRCRKS